MKTKTLLIITGIFLMLASGLSPARATDVQISSWITTYSGTYARIYTNDVSRTNGITVTTWNNSRLAQTLPAYRGVQGVYYSSNWVYIRTTDLGQYIMGPWYNDATRTTLFVNFPTNQKTLYVLPRTSTLVTPPAAKQPTPGSLAEIGYLADGVAMYDALDGFVWNGSTEVGGGNYQWRRAAYPNELITLDPANSHEQNTGEYHNHADPIAVRYLLGDHVDFNPATKIYSESTSPPSKHSPIIGWLRDGLPLYGPYGYSNPTNPASGIRRMVSGYQLRNGQNGSDNLTNVGRATLPAWMLRNNGNTTQTGPTVGTTYPAGRYLQDYAYLGDLTNAATGQKYQFGTDFDLNEYDVRYCVTPEFPNGTYAYFVTIDTNGTPIAPWNVGMYFYGNPTGYLGTNIAEAVTTNFSGPATVPPVLNSPTVNHGAVSLTWSAMEGGTYMVQSSTNLTVWNTNSTNVTATIDTTTSGVLAAGGYTNNPTDSRRFYRVGLTALANYDPVSGSSTNATTGTTSTQGIASVSPASGTHGTSVTLTITLNTSYNPPPPPATAPPTGVTLTGPATVNATSYSRDASSGVVTATFTLPSVTGSYTVNTVFGPNTWSLTNGFGAN